MFRLLAIISIFCVSVNVFSYDVISTKLFLDCKVSQQCIPPVVTDIVPVTNMKKQMLAINILPKMGSIAIIKPIQGQTMSTSMAILLLAIGLALIFFDDHLKKSKNRKK